MVSSYVVSPLDAIIAGSLSGMASVLVCHPLDVIRTKVQAVGMTSREAILSTLSGGLSSMFQGFLFPFCAQAIYKSVIFSANTISKQYLFQGDSSMISLFSSGVIAGSLNAFIVAPVELIRTTQILESRGKATQPSISSIIRNFYHQRGVLSLWSGLIPTIVRDGPGIGFYLLAFEALKMQMIERHGLEISSVPLWVRITAGSVAGVAFWTWAIPVDTVKTLIESALLERPSGSIIAHVSRRVSLRHLYSALPLAYMRGIPSAAATLTTYDVVIDFLKELKR